MWLPTKSGTRNKRPPENHLAVVRYCLHGCIDCVKKLMGRRIHDLTNQRFGRLKAYWPVGKIHKHVCWLVSCRCGTLKIAEGSKLVDGDIRSCGCLVRDTSRALIYMKHPCLRHG